MLKSFDQLDAERAPGAGAAAVLTPTASKPAREVLADFPTVSMAQQAEDISKRSVFAAAFRQDNVLTSLVSRRDAGLDNHDDGVFDPVAFVKEHKLEGYERSFMGVMNSRYAEAIKSRIETEKTDRQTLDAAGWGGTVAQLAAGVFDLPTLIPGAVAVRGAGAGWAVGRSVLMGGASTGAAQAATELALQATHETRTAQESYMNVGAAVVIGSLLGGGVAAVLGKNERVAAERALREIGDINSGLKPNEFVPAQLTDQRGAAAGGAETADGAFFVDPINVARTRDEMGVAGRAANAAVDLTSWFNPVLRGTQRYAASARQHANTLYESTIYRVMHGADETTGASVETMIRSQVSASQAQALRAAEASYTEMRSSGARMSKTDFYAEVGRAMRNNDEHDNAFVARAAQGYRKLFDDYTGQALKLGLLEEKDLDVKTAASYFSRIYNRDRLLQSEPEFLATISRHFAERMGVAYEKDLADTAVARARFEQRRADLDLAGPARAAKIDELRVAGDDLDKRYAHLSDLVDALSEARGAVRGTTGPAREQAIAARKALEEQGGPELEAYLKQRAELRARERNLTERNPDAQAARGEQIQERLDRVQEQVEKSLSRYSSRIHNILKKVESDPVGRAEELLAITQREFDKLAGIVGRAEERVAGLDFTDAYFKGGKLQRELSARRERLAAIGGRLARRETAPDAAREMLEELKDTIAAVTGMQAARDIRRGEQVARLKARAAALSPEQVADRAKSRMAGFNETYDAQLQRLRDRWGTRLDLDRERGATYDFEAAGRAAAKEIFDKLTGNTQRLDDTPSFVVKVTSGPLKDRTFMAPDELLAGKGWLVDDVREVANRYSRAMAGEIELTRRYGSADMKKPLAETTKEYSDMQVAVSKAATVDEVNKILGRDKFSGRTGLEKAKAEAQRLLALDARSAITDMTAGRDLIRGTHNAELNNSNFASITRSVMGLNYMRQMGGVLLSNVADFYRAATAAGLVDGMRHIPGHMAQAFGKGSAGLKASLEEARLSGLVIDRVNSAMIAANGDVADPFLSRTTNLERLVQRGTNVASRWNLVNYFTDAQQAIASTLSQHRLLEAVLGNGGKDGSFSTDGTRLMRMLGIDRGAQADIARFFAAHGETIDGIRVANTEKWLRAANESGVAGEVLRAENAVRAYRAAVNMDVNSIVSRAGIGDRPLFANHPVGKMLTQFSGYAMGAHSRVMIRGLQEDQQRLVGGLVAMSTIGAMTAYLAAWRGGRERFDKFVEDVNKDPSKLVSEGLDRSGFFPLLFDISGRVERASGGVGVDYRFNPVKSSISKLTGHSALGVTSTRQSDASGLLSAVGGPTAGLAESVVAGARVVGDKLGGKTPPKRDTRQALGTVPFGSYYGMRELLQVLHGDSPYTRQ